jgi:hypothetical protein
MSNLPYSKCLTNELLSRQSKSQFELVGRAIKIAEYLVKSGKATTEWPDNVANEVLRRIAEEGIDQLEHEVMQEEG